MIRELINKLLEIEYGTDPHMRTVQKYNLPHFVDLGLSFFYEKYHTVDKESVFWRNEYVMNNFYTPSGNLSDMKFPQTYMNQIMSREYVAHDQLSPFILFQRMPSGAYREININRISIEMKLHSRPMLYIEATEYIPVEDLICLLLPFKTKYQDYANGSDDYNGLGGNCFNFTGDGRAVLPSSINTPVYESIKLLPTTISMYFGTINRNDIAIKIEENLKFGEKIYIESILLFNPDGELLPDISDYFDEFENNIFTIKQSVSIVGWHYYVFYYKEADLSVNNIYAFPQYVIDNDTEAKILGTGKFILGEAEFDKLISETNALSAESLRASLRAHPSLAAYERFLSSWMEMVVAYRYNMFDNYIADYDEANKAVVDTKRITGEDTFTYTDLHTLLDIEAAHRRRDKMFFSVARKLKSYKKNDNGEIVIRRKVWRLYDDKSYSGYCDVLLFINGYLDITPLSYNKGDTEFIIDTDLIDDEKYGNNPLLEIVQIANVRDKDIFFILENDKSKRACDINSGDMLKLDRYYNLNSVNFFNREKYPMISMRTMDYEEPTLQYPIAFDFDNDDYNYGYDYQNKKNDISIYFDEHWCTAISTSDISLKKDNIAVYINPESNTYCAIYKEGNTIKRAPIEVMPDTGANHVEGMGKYYIKYNSSTNISFSGIDKLYTFSIDADKCGVVGTSATKQELYLFNGSTFVTKPYTGKDIFPIASASNDYQNNKIYLLNDDNTVFEFNNISFTQLDLVDEIYVITSETDAIKHNIVTDMVTPFGECSAIYLNNSRKIVALSTQHYSPTDMSALCIFTLDKNKNLINREYIELPIHTVGYTLIKGDNEDDIYMLGGDTYSVDYQYLFYKYTISTNTVTKLAKAPTAVGCKEFNSFCKDGYIYIVGGLNSYLEQDHYTTTIGIYDIRHNVWKVNDTNIVLASSSMAVMNDDSLVLVGGYAGTYIDNIGLSRNIYKIPIADLKDSLKMIKIKPIGQLPPMLSIAGGKAYQDPDDPRSVYIIGVKDNKYEVNSYLYRLNIDTFKCIRINEMPMEFTHSDIVDITDYSKDSCMYFMLLDNRNVGENYSRMLRVKHNAVGNIFVDQWSNPCIIINDFIYRHEENEEVWMPRVDITKINAEGKLKKIQYSSNVYVGVMDNGMVITSPDLDRWYSYNDMVYGYYNGTNFYSDENFTKLIRPYPAVYFMDIPTGVIYNLDTYKEADKRQNTFIESQKVIDIELINTENINLQLMVYENKVEQNPFHMNLYGVYGNNLVMASKNRFAAQYIELDEGDEYCNLGDDFKYCVELDRYTVFKDGVLLDPTKYIIAMPKNDNPINALYIYFTFEVVGPTILTVVYTPFPLNDYKEVEYPKNGLITIVDDEDEDLNHFGLSNDFYWLFTNGRKIPYSYTKDINKNMLQITSDDSIEVYETILFKKLLNDYNETKREKPTYKSDIFSDQMRVIIGKMKDWGIDEYYTNNIQKIVDTDIPVEYKLVLLRIYSDHYVANANEQGFTPPFDLDEEFPFYPVLNGGGNGHSGEQQINYNDIKRIYLG